MATPIFDHTHSNIFQSNFNFHESVSTCKKIRVLHHSVLERVDLKILQSDWLKAFWPISWEPDFSQIWDLCKTTANNINFRKFPNSE